MAAPNAAGARFAPRLMLQWARDRTHRGGALLAMLFGALLPLSQVTESLDLKLFDAGMRALAEWRAPSTSDEIVIVGLDEATLASFAEPMALLHPHLASFLEGMAQAGARAAAVDLILPEVSYDAIAPGHDARLIRGILAMRHSGIVMLALTVDEAGRPRTIFAPFVAAAGPSGTGFALFAEDRDGVVRRFDERLGADGSPVSTFSGELARRLGYDVAPGLIDFSRRIEFSVVPLHDVLSWIRAGETQRMTQAFRGKVVLLGAMLPFLDQHRVPLQTDAATTPGVLIHAQALRALGARQLIHETPAVANAVGGALCALAWFGATTSLRALAVSALASFLVLALGASLLAMGWMLPAASLLAAAWVAAGARLGMDVATEIRTRRRLRHVFAGYVSPLVMKELEAGRLEGMTSTRRFVCVLFVDVRGFTSRAENAPPEQVTAALNALFEMATDVIHRHRGTVKEFMGDGVMAFFGAPQSLDNPARSAFDSAREICDAMPRVNTALREAGHEPLSIGMGLACGLAVVGHIGAASRHTYGAVGDCVNLASRLEGLSKELGYSLLVSKDAHDLIGADIHMAALGTHRIKGHSPVDVYGWRRASAGGDAGDP